MDGPRPRRDLFGRFFNIRQPFESKLLKDTSGWNGSARIMDGVEPPQPPRLCRRFPGLVVWVSVVAAAAVLCLLAGFWNYRQFVLSAGSVEAEIRLDSPGKSTVTLDPPGRSLFRPGGVLEIGGCGKDGRPGGSSWPFVVGSIKVTDAAGRPCLDCSLAGLISCDGRTESYYRLPREFDTSHGGPYRVDIEITKPFPDLAGGKQKLVARHFRGGADPAVHYLLFGLAGCGGMLAAGLGRRAGSKRR